jgi:hypothetical protein
MTNMIVIDNGTNSGLNPGQQKIFSSVKKLKISLGSPKNFN